MLMLSQYSFCHYLLFSCSILSHINFSLSLPLISSIFTHKCNLSIPYLLLIFLTYCLYLWTQIQINGMPQKVTRKQRLDNWQTTTELIDIYICAWKIQTTLFCISFKLVVNLLTHWCISRLIVWTSTRPQRLRPLCPFFPNFASTLFLYARPSWSR